MDTILAIIAGTATAYTGAELYLAFAVFVGALLVAVAAVWLVASLAVRLIRSTLTTRAIARR